MTSLIDIPCLHTYIAYLMKIKPEKHCDTKFDIYVLVRYWYFTSCLPSSGIADILLFNR